jgi:hypothetical protein
MNPNPVTVLVILLAGGACLGGIFWGLSERSKARGESEKLRAALEEARAAAAGAADTADLATTTAEELEEQVAFLKKELEKARDENRAQMKTVTQLQEQLGSQGTEAAPPTSAQAIAESVYGYRQRKPTAPFTFLPTPRRELSEKIAAGVRAAYPPDEMERRMFALVSIGFVFDPEFESGKPTFNMDESLVGLRTNQEAFLYDSATRTLQHPDDAPLGNQGERGKFIEGVVRALARDLPDAGANLATVPDNADMTVARRSLEIGDATQVKIRYNLMEQFSGGVAPPPSPESQQQFYGAPIFLRELALFPYFHGSRFVEILQKDGGWNRVDDAYSRAPRSTAEILHPELYLADPPFTPTAIDLPAGPVAGVGQAWADTAGELGLRLYFTMVRSEPKVGEKAAEGWTGDRYAVFENGGYFWELSWENPNEAAEFFMEMRDALLRRYEIPFDKDFVQAGAFVAGTDGRVLRMRYRAGDKTRVQVAVAEDEAFADALESSLGGRP